MKIKVKELPYDEVAAIEAPPHKNPRKQSAILRFLLRVLSAPELWATRFRVKRVGMERLGRREPALYLMNHCSFIDLKIASTLLFPRRFSIVCTTDALVGKRLLMRFLGCIPTNKFVSDVRLLHDMAYAARELKSSVLMYPEAGYSFDGRATALPENFGKCIKMLGLPVVMIETHGAFARDPLYNNLQVRKVPVSAEMRYLLSPEEIAEKSDEEITALIGENFNFDAFRWQQEERIRIDEPFRADCLNRLLYKCPACHAEGRIEGKGIHLTCHACGKRYELDEYGYLVALEGETEFPHLPDWYAWERACVRGELERGEYRLDTAVDIYMLVDSKCLYRVGEGRLVHDREGFSLTGCDGKLNYKQGPLSAHTLNADFNWYEIGDVISIGNRRALYYCFPKEAGDIAAKTRLATEELYKLARAERAEKAKEKAPV